jgi:hypothetical protein
MIQLIRCTQKLQKEMGLKKSELFTEKTDNSRLGEWVANLIYIERRKCMVFVKDYLFPSPSQAASTVLGRSTNGWTMWKDSKGRTLDELKRK